MRGAASREQDKVTYAWLFAQSKAQHGGIVALSVLCALQAALLSFVLARTLRGRLKALHKAVQEKEGAVRVFLQEALEHQLVIRSFGAQPATSAHADALQEDHF